MRRDLYDEHVIHGTIGFPVGIYNYSNKKGDDVIFAIHYHREFELFIVTEGKVKLQVESETFYLEPGQGVFINSGELHSTFTVTQKCRCMSIVFSPEFIAPKQEELYEMFINPIIKRNISFSPELTKDIIDLAFASNMLFQEKDKGYELFIKSNLTRIIALLVSYSDNNAVEKTDTKRETIKIVLDCIHDNYQGNLTLQDMADTVHMSKEYLCSIFKEVSGFSPITYLNRYRIMQSAYMLRNSSKKISVIATECGFNGSSYFNKQFLHFMKYTPKEYRRIMSK